MFKVVAVGNGVVITNLVWVIMQTLESAHRESSDCVRSYVASLVKQNFVRINFNIIVQGAIIL